MDSLQEDLTCLNKKIDQYNLVVPILSKQMVHFPLQRIAEQILKEGDCYDPKHTNPYTQAREDSNLLQSRERELKGNPLSDLISMFKS